MAQSTGLCDICRKNSKLVHGTKVAICANCYIEISNMMYLAYRKDLERSKHFKEERRLIERNQQNRVKV
jgi:hypothetical protein